MLPKTIDEEDLHNMFAPYGELREVHIIRGPEGSSKGCAFVKFVDRDAAMVAIEDMNDIIPPVILECLRFHVSLAPLPCPLLHSLIDVTWHVSDWNILSIPLGLHETVGRKICRQQEAVKVERGRRRDLSA